MLPLAAFIQRRLYKIADFSGAHTMNLPLANVAEQLEQAVTTNDFAIIKTLANSLIEQTASNYPDEFKKYLNVLIEKAITANHLESVKELLGALPSEIRLEVINPPGSLPEHLATTEATFVLGSAIVGSHPPRDSVSTKQSPPLVIAAGKGHIDIIEYLLNLGAHIEGKDKQGRTALFRALTQKCFDVVEYLIRRGASIHAQTETEVRILDAALAAGDRKWVDYFIEQGIPLNHQNKNGSSPLHFAAQSSNVDLVRFVMQQTSYTADLANSNGRRPIDFSRNIDIFQHFLQTAPGIELNPKFSTGYYAIHHFALNGMTDIVRYLLDHDVDIQLLGPDKNTVLHYAVSSGNRDLVEYLLRQNAKPNARNKAGYTPLHWAAEKGNIDIASLLLDYKAKINLKGSTSFIIRAMRTPLFMAIEEKQFEMAKFLVERGADVNAINDTSCSTALTKACLLDAVDLIQFLLKQGANPNGISRSDRKDYHYFPLYWASSAEAVELLVAAGADVNASNYDGETAVGCLVGRLDDKRIATPGGQKMLQALKALIAHGADVTSPKEARWSPVPGPSPLTSAKCMEVAEILLQTAEDKQRQITLLSPNEAKAEAGLNRYWEGIKSMVGIRKSPSKNLDTKNSGLGEMLFNQASHLENDRSVESFLTVLERAQPEDIRYRDIGERETILHRILKKAQSSKYSREEISLPLLKKVVEKLLEKGAAVNAVETLFRETPLHKAVKSSVSEFPNVENLKVFVEIMELLIQHGANLNVENENGAHPLDLAKDEIIIDYLQAKGGKFGKYPKIFFDTIQYSGTNQGNSPDFPKIISILIDKGVNIESRNEHGHTPLLFTAFWNQPELMQLLLQKGANPHACDGKGGNLLHVACEIAAFRSVEFALKHLSLDMNARNQEGKTPLHYALMRASEKYYQKGGESAALLVVEHGARLDITDSENKTPLDYLQTKKMEKALLQAAKKFAKTPH